MADTERRYHLTFHIQPHVEPVPKPPESESAYEGACDLMIMAIMSRTDDPDVTHTRWGSIDGKTGKPAPVKDAFLAWLGLAKYLAKSSELPTNARAIVQKLVDAIGHAESGAPLPRRVQDPRARRMPRRHR